MSNIYLEKIASEDNSYGKTEVAGMAVGAAAGNKVLNKAREKSLKPLVQAANKATDTASKTSKQFRGSFNADSGIDQSARYKQLASRAATTHGLKDGVNRTLTKMKSATKHMGTVGALGGAVLGFDIAHKLSQKFSKKDK